MKHILSPSILAADFGRLGEQIKMTRDAGAPYLHIDVMDGLFVPSISFGMPVIRSIRPLTGQVFDVHLMVQDPDRYIDEFADCGADIITVHAEACRHLDRTLQMIAQKGCKRGVALNPATPLNVLEYVLDQVDMILIMSVNPGFGGQSYLPYAGEKIRTLRDWLTARGLQTDIEVDGGINDRTLPLVLDAGANVIVAGSSVFGSEDIPGRVQAMTQVMQTYDTPEAD